MGKRQYITIDITFEDGWGVLSASDFMKMLIEKRSTVKSVSIQVVNKRKEKK